MEVARGRRRGLLVSSIKTILIVFESEFSRIFADDFYVLPSEPCEPLSSYATEGRGEIDQIDAGEELWDVDELGHGLDVPSRSATNLVGTPVSR